MGINGRKLSESESNLIRKFNRLKFGDTSVFYTKEGEIIPEMEDAMMIIQSYVIIAQAKQEDPQPPQWFDLDG
jgi:hypothetical protein